MNRNKAFTILELLGLIVVLSFLVGFFIHATNQMKAHTNFAKMQYELASLAKSIELFESDWQQLPKGLDLLSSQKKLNLFAKNKKTSLVSRIIYYNHPKLLKGLNIAWVCPWYDPLGPPTAPSGPSQEHLSEASTGDKCMVNINSAATGWTWQPHNVDVVLKASLAPEDSSTQFPVDLWGNFIYYNSNGSNGHYILMAPGPEYKSASNTEAAAEMLNFMNKENVSEKELDSYAIKGFIIYGRN